MSVCGNQDAPKLHQLRESAESWLAHKNTDQYQGGWSAKAHAQIDQLLSDQRFVALKNSFQDILAVGALVGPDPDFWTAEDEPRSAWYVSRLMVSVHGRGVGARLLDMLTLAAAIDGRKYLRLDCWRANKALHRYYEDNGFVLVRIVETPGRQSGALFQRICSSALPTAWDFNDFAED
jgi:GNAT superfamily N-acetyltransferase